MNQGRTITAALLLLDLFAVLLVFNAVGVAWGVVQWGSPVLLPLVLPVLMHVLAVHLIDGYSAHTDMMSVTYTSLHAIALGSVLLFTLLLTYAFIPAGFALQGSRLVITGACLLLIPVTLSYRRFLYQHQQARKHQRYFLFLGSPDSCVAFKEECRRTGMTQAVLYATHETFTRGRGQSAGQGSPVEHQPLLFGVG